jgi:hypothetical protein
VIVQGNVAVGAVLPPSVILYPVPPGLYVAGDPRLYGYAVVNGVPVVVDIQTRVILAAAG